MKEDYPKYVLEKRKELQEQLRLEREKGNIAIIKYDKLIVTKHYSKRKLPTSPEITNIQNEEKNTKSYKKNRTQQSGSSVIRSNSISEGVMKPGMLNFLVNKNITKINNNPDSKNKST